MDCREWKPSAIDPHNRHTWRSGVRSACSKPATWRGPLIRLLPLYLHVNKKSDGDDDDDDDGFILTSVVKSNFKNGRANFRN